jgi:hypothetical protein
MHEKRRVGGAGRGGQQRRVGGRARASEREARSSLNVRSMHALLFHTSVAEERIKVRMEAPSR